MSLSKADNDEEQRVLSVDSGKVMYRGLHLYENIIVIEWNGMNGME